jgi:hypothetical protein
MVFEFLKKEGERSGLFCLAQGVFDGIITSEATRVFLSVSDMAQISQDKNGEKVFIDEQQFPAPTFLAIILRIGIAAKQYQDVLESAGSIICYLKDNNTFHMDEFNWHGNQSNSFYMEPVIRETEINQVSNYQAIPFVSIEYRIELAINSEKSGAFTRVQSKDIRGKPM